MLDELREYREYTNEGGCERLRSKEFGSENKEKKGAPGGFKFGGLGRPMTIIARRFLFSTDNLSAGAEQAKKALEIWLGYSDDAGDRRFAGLAGSLHSFMDRVYPEKYERMRESLAQKKDKFLIPIFSKNEQNAGNDYYSLTYDRAIAIGCADGPLKRYYLVCEGVPFDDWRLMKDGGELKKARDRFEDKVLKLTAFYLLNRPGLEWRYVTFPQRDFVNWLGQSGDASGAIRELTMLSICPPNEKPLALFEKIDRKGVPPKLRVCPEWADRFTVVPEEELNEVLKEMEEPCFFSDWGSGERLKRDERYPSAEDNRV